VLNLCFEFRDASCQMWVWLCEIARQWLMKQPNSFAAANDNPPFHDETVKG